MTEPPSAAVYGQSLTGLGFNLIVRDVNEALKFLRQVLGALVEFQSEGFAALQLKGQKFMLHADNTYRGNPLYASVAATEVRGIGVELRVYDLDPDQAEHEARVGGWTVLAGAMEKPHGLRECMILDQDGYCWIPSVHLR